MQSEAITDQQASALLMAARCCYIQDNLTEGINLCLEACKIAPERMSLSLELGRLYLADGQVEQACITIWNAIYKDKFLYAAIIADPTFASNVELMRYIENCATAYVKSVDFQILDLFGKAATGGMAEKALLGIRREFQEKTFFFARTAGEKLVENAQWTLTCYELETNFRKYDKVLSCSVADLVLREKSEVAKKQSYENLVVNHAKMIQDAKNEAETKRLLRKIVIYFCVVGVFVFIWCLAGLKHGFVSVVGKFFDIVMLIGVLVGIHNDD